MKAKDFKQILEGNSENLDDEIYDDDDLIERMLDFILELDPESLTEDQGETLNNILDEIESYEDEEDVTEGLPARKTRRDLKKKRERSRKYRKSRVKLRLKAKKYRKSAKGKLMAKKRKRMAKRGRTATGKRKKTFIN